MLSVDISSMDHIEAVLFDASHISGVLNGIGSLTGELSIEKKPDPYTGSYEITPRSTQQVLYSKNKLMTDDIRVLPIPSNYGLITWNGSVLTVS